MSDMKYLKVVDAKWKGYTGALGIARFVDGVSETMLPRHIRDRMAAAMNFVEIDADGNEQPAGAAHRMIREYAERAAPVKTLSRQTEGEKNAEIAASQVALAKFPVTLTRSELEAIASKGGIKALREVADKWNVKHRSIPTLIEMVLDAQEKAVAKTRKLELPVESVAKDEDEASPLDWQTEADIAAAHATADREYKDHLAAEAVKAAAASGDLATAVSIDETPQE